MIYTSYYARWKHFDRDRFLRVSISAFVPSWLRDYVDGKALAPSMATLMGYKKGRIDEETYTRNYHREIEEKGGIGFILQHLKEWEYEADGRDIVLFCYETPDKFCHRHLLASWVNQYEGRKVIKEYPFPGKKKASPVPDNQPTLF